MQVLITESEEERKVVSAEARGEREVLALVSFIMSHALGHLFSHGQTLVGRGQHVTISMMMMMTSNGA